MKIDKTWYIKPERARVETSAGGVVVCKNGTRILVGLTRENDYPDFVLPKGHLEKGESAEEAAIREIQEEAGLDSLKLICNLGTKERMNGEKEYWKITHYFLFTTTYVTNNQVNWFPIDQLPEMFFPEQKQLIEENREKIKNLVL